MTSTQDLVATSSIIIDAPRARVWRALIDPAAAKQYMFGADVRSDWEQGSPITWAGEFNGKPFKDKGEVLHVERERTLQYSHFSATSGQPDKPENYHVVTIDLSDAGGKTRVTLQQNNNSTEAARQHSQQNWDMMLQGLKKVVEAKK